MLGLKSASVNWQWGIYGKHPAFQDYLYHNVVTPVFRELTGWIDTGMHLMDNGTRDYSHFSYRFWVRGIKRGDLVCGILRTSSDSSGRSYPLAVMGAGRMDGWEKRWDRIFLGFDPVLRSLEEITALKFNTFNELENKLNGLFSSRNRYDHVAAHMAGKTFSNGNDLLRNLSKVLIDQAFGLAEQDRVSVPFGQREDGTFPSGSTRPNGLFRRSPPLPLAVFWGGSTTAQTFLKLFKKPLSATDFRGLFT